MPCLAQEFHPKLPAANHYCKSLSSLIRETYAHCHVPCARIPAGAGWSSGEDSDDDSVLDEAQDTKQVMIGLIYVLDPFTELTKHARNRGTCCIISSSRSCAGDPQRDEEPADEEAVQVQRGLADAAPVVELCFRLVVHSARSKNRPRHGVKSQDVRRGGGGSGRGEGGGRGSGRRWGRLRRGRRERGVLLREELLHTQHEPGGDRGVVGVHDDDRPAVGDVDAVARGLGALPGLRGVAVRAVPSASRPPAAAAAQHACRLVAVAQERQ